MKTKKYIYLIIIAAGLLGISSCSEKFLEPDVPQVDEETYFSNEDNARLALTGCYNVMAWDADNQFPFWLGDILGHDSYKGGEGAGDQPWIEPLLKFQYDANNEGLVTPYKNYFVGVGRCNRLIEKVGAMSEDAISDSLKKQFIAEAKFIRGYFYFELVKTFGKVPLITKSLTPEEYQQPLAEITAVYTQIENDFSAAALVLPEKSEYPSTDMGRATKGAASAMLCKAYIYQKKWQQAREIAEEIILAPKPEYSLEANFADNWAYPIENGPESVFEIQFGTLPGGSNWGDGNAGNVFVIFTRSRNIQDGWGFNCPTQNLYDEFEPADNIRRNATFITDGEILWDGSDQIVADCNFPSNKDKLCSKKYQLPLSLQADNMSDDPNNWIVIRYAEVLLWAAEAAYYSPGVHTSDYYLQMVRDRVHLGPSPLVGLDAIFHERRCELAMEGHAYWDIVRSGRGSVVFGADYNEAANHYFLIPQSQVDLGGF